MGHSHSGLSETLLKGPVFFKVVLAFTFFVFFFMACFRGIAGKESRGSFYDRLRAGQDIFIRGETFEEDVDFSEILGHFIYSGDLSQATCNANIVFEDCTFKGRLTGSKKNDKGWSSTFFDKNVTFVNCDFEDEVIFRKSVFQRGARFLSNTFFKDVNFEEVSFRGAAVFQENHFFEDTRFQNAVFHEPVTFFKTFFHRYAGFQGCRFYDHAQWSQIQILGYGDFTITEFDRDFIFNYAECPGKVIFDHSFFRKRAEWIDLKAKDFSARSCFFESLETKGMEVSGILDIEGSRIATLVRALGAEDF